MDDNNSNDQNSGVAGMPPPGKNSPNDVDQPEMPHWKINTLGILLIVFSVLTGYLIFSFWPDKVPADEVGKAIWKDTTYLFCSGDCKPPCNDKAEQCMITVELTAEQRIIILVLLAGALGSFIHAGTSFSNYVGQRKIEKSWIWWYLLRPIIGMSVALVFYLVFRGGLVNDTPIETLNIYGVLTMSALTGLFTDRATLKLEEVFQSLFQPEDKRKDKLTNGTEVASSANAEG